ncbi:NAD(P)/FAD-dependent oxidoreductase [Pandoraea terrigena]|nr:FAD-dependent oxidoreductase [Pandoraea terrigena]
MKFDTLVLGGGIVGVCVAVHLQQRGHAVALVDRKAPGNETSFGNAGLIQREGVYPYALPRDFATLMRYARNRSPDVRYHARAMPKVLPFLYRYWYHSRADRHAAIARSYSTLIEHCVDEHRALVEASGAQALLRTGGWLKVFRSARKHEAELRVAEQWRSEYGVAFQSLDVGQLRRDEPSLGHALIGALRYTDADSVSDPNALVAAYARYFETLGGRIFIGDAATLTPKWGVNTEAGRIDAHSAVIALGPWSDLVTTRMGYRLPLAVKRGYHMHYAAQEGARLNQPVLDAEVGYMMTPMARGIRLTTGAELAFRDAPATPVQLSEIEPFAREMFPLGKRLEAQPWLGCRPCTPDMMPIIGPANRHRDLWFAFGHAHHGLTLGPITGRLLAEMMVGADPIADPRPFRADRFGD